MSMLPVRDSLCLRQRGVPKLLRSRVSCMAVTCIVISFDVYDREAHAIVSDALVDFQS